MRRLFFLFLIFSVLFLFFFFFFFPFFFFLAHKFSFKKWICSQQKGFAPHYIERGDVLRPPHGPFNSSRDDEENNETYLRKSNGIFQSLLKEIIILQI